MISNPSLIFYACVSKGNTILAEFNSRDADLATLASKCLEKAPLLHVNFSHTVRKKTYTFLMDDPFVYFSIYDESLENSEALSFLHSVKKAFDKIIISENVRSKENLNSHHFQGEFNPVFHQLLASLATEMMEGPQSPLGHLKHGRSGSLDSPRGKRIGSVPLLGGDSRSLKKKKKKLSNEGNGECKDGLVENKVDFSKDANAIVLSRDFSMSMHKGGMSMQKGGLFGDDTGQQQKAKRVWKRHVWVVLSLDLIVCCILFGVWLWICRGFKCIDG